MLRKCLSVAVVASPCLYYTYKQQQQVQNVAQLIEQIDVLQQQYQQANRQAKETYLRPIRIKMQELEQAIYYNNNHLELIHQHAQGYKVLQRAMITYKDEHVQHCALLILNEMAPVEKYAHAILKNGILGSTFSTIFNGSDGLQGLARQLVDHMALYECNHEPLLAWVGTFKAMAETRQAKEQDIAARAVTRMYSNRKLEMAFDYADNLPFSSMLRFMYDYSASNEIKQIASVGLLFAQKNYKLGNQELAKYNNSDQSSNLIKYSSLFALPAIWTIGREYITKVPTNPIRIAVSLGCILVSGALHVWNKKNRFDTTLQQAKTATISNEAPQTQLITMWSIAALQSIALLCNAQFIVVPALCQYVVADMYRYYRQTHGNARLFELQNAIKKQ